jgi:hypothetical protein
MAQNGCAAFTYSKLQRLICKSLCCGEFPDIQALKALAARELRSCVRPPRLPANAAIRLVASAVSGATHPLVI